MLIWFGIIVIRFIRVPVIALIKNIWLKSCINKWHWRGNDAIYMDDHGTWNAMVANWPPLCILSGKIKIWDRKFLLKFNYHLYILCILSIYTFHRKNIDVNLYKVLFILRHPKRRKGYYTSYNNYVRNST